MTSTCLRTCVATRNRRPMSELLRVVIDKTDPRQSRLVADPERRLPGRGAWITPELSALELAERHRAFARAFRASKHLDTGLVRQFLESLPKAPGGSTRQQEKRKTEH